MEKLPRRIMGITEFLKNKDLSLIEMQEPSNSDYKCFNTGGVECEIGEFLYGLVRMMKPNNIFETGTHMGISSSYMAQALKDNGRGLLTTVEIEKEHIRRSQERWETLEISHKIMVDKEESLQYVLEYDCELMFLDSEPEFRFRELIRFFPRLKPGGIVFIHDMPRSMCQGNVNPDHPNYKSWPYGDLPVIIKQWVKEEALRPFLFQTPRGLIGFYKTHPEDFVW